MKRGVAKVSCSKSARHWMRRLPPATRHYCYCVMRGSCIGIDYERYGHILGVYRRSGERGRKMGAGKEGKGREKKGRKKL